MKRVIGHWLLRTGFRGNIVNNDSITPFKIDVAPEVLTDLQQRLKSTRWSYQVGGTHWEAGTDLNYVKELVAYWQDTYDWRRHEAALNRFAHFKTEVDNIGIHFVHERGKGPNPFPLILTHGYPDSFYRFAKLIPMLTDPESFGGQAEDSFDVVVPDLPGYGFSDRPPEIGTIFRVNDLWAQLMTDRLSYQKFGRMAGIGVVASLNNSLGVTPIPWWPFISRTFLLAIYSKNPKIPPRLKRSCSRITNSGFKRQDSCRLSESSSSKKQHYRRSQCVTLPLRAMTTIKHSVYF
jgi:hypothetical protein